MRSFLVPICHNPQYHRIFPRSPISARSAKPSHWRHQPYLLFHSQYHCVITLSPISARLAKPSHLRHQPCSQFHSQYHRVITRSLISARSAKPSHSRHQPFQSIIFLSHIFSTLAQVALIIKSFLALSLIS